MAKPELETILREKHTVENAARDLRERLPAWLSQAPEMPGLVHDYLVKATRGQLVTRIASEDLAALRREHSVSHRKTLSALAAGSTLLAGSLFMVTDTGPWFLWGYSAPGIALLAMGAWLFMKMIMLKP